MIAHSSEVNGNIEKLMEKSNIEYEKGNIPEGKDEGGSIDFHKGKAYFELGNHEESLTALKESVKKLRDSDILKMKIQSIWTSLETLRSTWDDKLRNLRRTRCRKLLHNY